MSWARILSVALGAAGLLRAADEDRLVVAAMHLSDQASYTWTSTIVDDARTYEVEGRTVKGGYTRVKTPVPNAIRRRLGRSVTDVQIEILFRGNVRCAFDTDDGWKTLDELPRPDIRGPDVQVHIPTTPNVVNKPPKPRDDEIEVGRYSNLQLSISHPHEELAVILMNHAGLKFEGNLVTGTITDAGARLLLVHDGQTEISPLRGSGTFKLHLRGNTVARYQVALDGTLAVETSVGRREIDVHQTMDTTLSAIGMTRVDVPEEARRKLDR